MSHYEQPSSDTTTMDNYERDFVNSRIRQLENCKEDHYPLINTGQQCAKCGVIITAERPLKNIHVSWGSLRNRAHSS